MLMCFFLVHIAISLVVSLTFIELCFPKREIKYRSQTLADPGYAHGAPPVDLFQLHGVFQNIRQNIMLVSLLRGILDRPLTELHIRMLNCLKRLL